MSFLYLVENEGYMHMFREYKREINKINSGSS